MSIANENPTGTTLIYNGVVLSDCITQSFRQDIVRDESDSDSMFSEFTISVTSTVVGFAKALQPENAIQVAVPVTVSSSTSRVRGSIAEQIRAAHQKLSEHGKDFWFLVADAPTDNIAANANPNVMVIATGDRPVTNADQIAVDPTNPTSPTVAIADVTDCKNGPHPVSVNVEQIFGGRTMRVTLTMKVCRKICDPNLVVETPEVPGMTKAESDPLLVNSGSQVLSNRWTISETKDANWYTTRTLEGTLRIISMSAIAHAQRYLVVPALLRGYQRTSQSFVTDPTGLTLKYRIEDRQRHEAPPRPAIEWSGTVTEAAAGVGAIQHSEIQLNLVGPPGVDKQKLIGVAGQVVAQRMQGIQKDPTNANEAYFGILDGASIVDVIGQPQIQMRVRFKRTKSTDSVKLGVRVKDIGKPLYGTVPPLGATPTTEEQAEFDRLSAVAIDGYDPEVWPVPHVFDRTNDRLVGVFTNYTQHPCHPYHNVFGGEVAISASQNTRPSTQTAPYTKDEDIRAYSSEKELDFDQSRVSRSYQEKFPFTFIKIRTEYIVDDGVVHLPYADSNIPASQATSVMIPMHSGLCQRVLKIEASRIGKLPVLPVPSETFTDENGIEERRMHNHTGIAAPEFQFDEVTQEYRVMMELRYALSRPPQPTEKLRMATSPIDLTTRANPGSTPSGSTNTRADRYINLTDLYDGGVIED